jgi:hypothetical protein
MESAKWKIDIRTSVCSPNLIWSHTPFRAMNLAASRFPEGLQDERSGACNPKAGVRGRLLVHAPGLWKGRLTGPYA